MTTINEQLNELRDAIEAQDGNVEDLIIALQSRRLRQAHKEQLAELIELFYSEEEEEEEEEDSAQNMAQHIAKYRANYVSAVAASGSKSLHNGDLLACFLEYKSEIEVMALADEFAPLENMTHAQKYGNLNRGQQRMSAGNKLRGMIKRGELDFTTDKSGNITGLKVAG